MRVSFSVLTRLFISYAAVVCRVCQLPAKKSAVLCAQCSLIAHAKCAGSAPPTCDLRAHLLLYAHYAEKEGPGSAYALAPAAAATAAQNVAMSDVPYVAPRTSLDGPSSTPPQGGPLASTSEHAPTAFRFMAAFRRSRTSLTPEPGAVAGTSTPPPPAKEREADDAPPPARRRPAVLHRRTERERPLSVTSDSTGLSSVRSAATAAESFSSRQQTGRRVQPAAGGRAASQITAGTVATTVATTTEPAAATRPEGVLPGALPLDDEGTRRQGKKYKAKSASASSCLIQ